MGGKMKKHLNWFFALLFGLALVGCQDQIEVNSPVDSQNSLSKPDENSPTDLQKNPSSMISEYVGCTRPVIYWKMHSIYGPGIYDPTWGKSPQNFDENTVFFNSGKSYYKILWTNSFIGSLYYMLAHQYIASRLNGRTGASVPPKVWEAVDGATIIFQTHTPQSIASLKLLDPLRMKILKYTIVLAAYNNGLLGPKRCD